MLARTDQNPAIRRAAEEELAERLAGIGSTPPTRRAALAAISDQRLLVSIVQQSRSLRSRREALDFITDQELLFGIATMRTNSGDQGGQTLADEAALKLSDQEALARLMRQGGPAFQPTADSLIGRLKGTDWLAELAEAPGGKWRDRIIAVLDPTRHAATLNRLARDRDTATRRAAASAIADPEVLFDIASHDQAISVALAAVRRLADRSRLADLLEVDRGPKFANAVMAALDGYFCATCKAPNYELQGHQATCVCGRCGGENHDFAQRRRVDVETRDHQTGEEWDQCRRCGLEANRKPYLHYHD
jgi:hypothetical protein